ncbi:hypothetical protein [Methylobacterium sp. WL6]|uniref:hypothetical protein n=1 Tax=Methylobacterium sp. WL6 TaxID=2603901 RepID=UPI0011C784A8|nr:hypothetical protein [Methylobacterium sp. WL6]TXN71723.1 hypothetical protein FV230_07320 [Methylobacterium sp. WL6]
MRFSEFFGLGKKQAELDFVDIDIDLDTRLFIDPYAIKIRNDNLSQEFAHHIVSFFEDVLRSLRDGDEERAEYLTSNLREPQETFLGMSRAQPQGRGVGPFNAEQLLYALRNSRAIKSGLLSDLADAELFIEGIGPDKISDLTTNIIRAPLIIYTQQQCELLGVPYANNVAVAPVWDPDARTWVSGYQNLPIVNGTPVILVPKVVVRRKLSLNSQEYYNFHVVNFLQAEHLARGSGLVKLLKDGTPKVSKKDVIRDTPFSKEFLADMTQKNPHILEFYKGLKGAQGAISSQGLDPDFNPRHLASELIERLRGIPTGDKHATEYQHAIAGIVTFLFYPDLISPILEQPMSEGRKRIDIVYTNWATEGFFGTLKKSPQTRARYIIVECKNYGKDIKNPEFDQLIGRFGPARGRFGIIACRTNDNNAAVEKRSRDAVREEQGLIMVLEDHDFIFMLDCIVRSNNNEMYRYLEAKYRAIVF